MKTFEELQINDCRMISGSGQTALYCGERALIGEAWCPAHFRVVYPSGRRPRSSLMLPGATDVVPERVERTLDVVEVVTPAEAEAEAEPESVEVL